MNIDINKMSEEQERLLNAFEKSGLSEEEFIKQYLEIHGVANSCDILQKINSTLAGIDKHYEALKKAKNEGKDRKAYLREICDQVFIQADSPAKAGAALCSVINALEGKTETSDSLNYDGIEAISLIDNLDRAIVNNTLSANGDKEN